MKHERAFVFLSLLTLAILTVGQFFSLVDKEFAIQRLEQEQNHLEEKLEKVERFSHGH